MSEYRLGGRVTIALTHFTMYGLAAILQDAGHRPVRFWWADENEAVPMLSVDLDWDQVAAIVNGHAQRALDTDAWLSAVVEGTSVSGRAMFSPRATSPSESEWSQYFDARQDRRPEGLLDQRMIAALGEPAWWRLADAGTPDAGASRWEMKTRNRGAEIIGDRLLPLARAVAARAPSLTAAGLAGLSVVDEAGRGSSESRSGTGFAPPGPVDNAVAWCALWGMTVVPPVRRVSAVSDTPGLAPRRVTHPTMAVLPVWTEPVSWGVVRSTVSSSEFDAAAFAVDDPVARDVLRKRGVRALVRFRVDKRGSASAPERIVLPGEVDVL